MATKKKIKPIDTKTVSSKELGIDVELSFYVWENKKGESYTVTIRVADAFVIYAKLMNGKHGWFISYPSYETKSGDYKNVCYCFDEELCEKLDAAVKEFADEYID